jgi:hypothetical protein
LSKKGELKKRLREPNPEEIALTAVRRKRLAPTTEPADVGADSSAKKRCMHETAHAAPAEHAKAEAAPDSGADSDLEIVQELSADEELTRQFEEAKRAGRYIEIDDGPDDATDRERAPTPIAAVKRQSCEQSTSGTRSRGTRGGERDEAWQRARQLVVPKIEPAGPTEPRERGREAAGQCVPVESQFSERKEIAETPNR